MGIITVYGPLYVVATQELIGEHVRFLLFTQAGATTEKATIVCSNLCVWNGVAYTIIT